MVKYGHTSQEKFFRLEDIAQRVKSSGYWKDLTLPQVKMAQLKDICNQAREINRAFDLRLSRRRGVKALFTGHSGAGKTMAAGVIANQLGLPLYRVDLSSVVSKYIGETEKNLSALFDAAKINNVVLFFDEADSLFGKRTGVIDAHDRYANIEVSYLLQRIEEYEGTVILATNMRNNLDEAFIRRIHYVVEFPFPTNEWRHKLWGVVWRWSRRILKKV